VVPMTGKAVPVVVAAPEEEELYEKETYSK
jgi:hypothetical protein